MALGSPPSSSGPFGGDRNYLDRGPERLVVNGLRLWSSGYQSGDLTPWHEAWNLHAVAFGAEKARGAVAQLAQWVETMCLWRPERLRCFGANCPLLCRDECLAAALIAACQHGDSASIQSCAERLSGPAGLSEVMESSLGYAQTLQALGQVLLPIPQPIVQTLVGGPKPVYH